jgi:hypothetical protein
VQDRQRQVSPKIRQYGLDSGTSPAHEVDQPPLDCRGFLLEALALTRQALERVAIGGGHVDGVGWHATEQRNGAENVGVGSIGLGMLAEVAAQRADALALDSDGLDAGLFKPAGDREPGHAGRLHDGSDGAVCR